jgi:hypothetical protein
MKKARYIQAEHCLQELPTLDKPDLAKYNNDHFLFYGPLKRYEEHLASLRKIPCSPGSVWEDGKVYEEGVDYEIYDNDPLGLMLNEKQILEAISITKDSGENRTWEIFREDFQSYADRILRDKGASSKETFDAINDTIEELKKYYTITRKQ